MFLDLTLEFGKGGLASSREMLALVGGVEFARRKREREREAEFLCSRNRGKHAVELDEIGIKTLQKFRQFFRASLQSFFSGSVTFHFSENDRDFHVCTCGNLRGNEPGCETAPYLNGA